MDKQSENQQYVGSTFFELLATFVKFRWLLFWVVFIITASATGYAVFSPKWYKSTASVFPAEKNDPLSMISGLSGLAKGFSSTKGLAALAGSNSEADRYKAILMSGTMTDDVIKRFELKKEYDRENDYYEKVVSDWLSNMEIEIQDEGNLTLTVYDKNPQKAADIANYMIAKLNEINTRLSVTNAKSNREFVEKRYNQSITDIQNYETAMKDFQEKYGVIAIPEQLKATVESMSSIYLDYYKKEIELSVKEQTYGKDHPLVEGTRIEMNEVLKKINQLNSGTDASQQDVKLIIPFKQAPELGNQYLKIYRNLEIQYKILEFVQPLYEQARVEENRNTPSVLVLDTAGPADHKAKPKILLYLLLGFVISLSLAIILVVIIESFSRLRNSNKKRFDDLMSIVKSDFRRTKR